MRQCNNLVESSNNESCDEEEDNGTTICKTYKISWIELTEKCGDWVQCDICNDQSAMTREIFPQMMIFVIVFASDHKYQGQISIQLSIWRLIMQ